MLISQVVRAIDELGLAGQDVCVHGSMRAFGEKIGADAVLDAFLGQDCTVMVPAFSYRYEVRPVPEYMPDINGAGNNYAYFLNREYEDLPPYDVLSREISTEDMGVFAERVLFHAQSVRGNHPLNSFAAVGRNAAQLVAGQQPMALYDPFRRLCAGGGYVLMMGTDLTSATIIHYAEQRAGRSPFIRWAKDALGKTVPVQAGGCSRGFGQFEEILAPLARRTQVGKSLWTCYPARGMAEACANAIKRKNEITRCNVPGCSRCRDALLGGPKGEW